MGKNTLSDCIFACDQVKYYHTLRKLRTDLILKITALVLAVAAIACLIMANMERISDWMACLWAKVQAKKELLCRTCPCEGCESDDEFEEWDI